VGPRYISYSLFYQVVCQNELRNNALCNVYLIKEYLNVMKMVLVTRKYVFCMKYAVFYFCTLLFETFFIQLSIQGVVLEIHAENYVGFS
jgi:hypothetical protein